MVKAPALRFPEFSGEWKEHYLADYLEFKNGLNPEAKEFGNGIKFISVMDILNNDFITYDCIRASVNISQEEQEAYAVMNGDILFQRSSETIEDVGRANVYIDDKPAVFGGFIIRGKKKMEYDPIFFKYLLASPYARRRIIPMGAGAQHFNIGQEGLSKVKLFVPKLQEQNKIADLLRLIDERIAVQRALIEKLETLIKGIVVTHHRKCPYKQFVEISKLGKSFSVGVLSKEDLVEDGTPCILYGELFTTYNCVADVIESRTNRTDNQVYSKGDELLFPASTTVDAVSLITPTALIVANVVLGGDMFGIHINKEYNAIYISYILNYVYRQRIAKYAQGCTIIHLHYKDIKNFKLSLPPIEKQEKIVNTLNSMQEKIDCEKQNLRLLNDLRSFLLSKLFI